MIWPIWIIAALALQEAGWMLFDGLRALITGDYVTPKKGPYAGQLGPWAKIVSSIGIAPRSSLMKIIFVLYGGLWLTITVFYLTGFSWAMYAMLVAAICSLWYLPIGTFFSAIQIVIILTS